MDLKVPLSVQKQTIMAIMRFARVAMVIAGLQLFHAPAMAQSVSTVASVALLEDGRVTKTADLDFGLIIPGNNGGTISVAPNGNVTITNTVISGGGTQPAAFNLTRQIFQDYPIYISPTVSDSIELIHQTDPAAKMVLTNFTTDFNRTGLFGLPAYFFATSYDFRVGGTLTVAASQLGGTYQGNFTVLIDYQ